MRRTRRTHRERRSIRVDRGPLGELTVDELARMGRALLHRDEDGVFDGYLVVEMGAGTQRVPIGPGPSILSVYATDDWSLDLQ